MKRGRLGEHVLQGDVCREVVPGELGLLDKEDSSLQPETSNATSWNRKRSEHQVPPDEARAVFCGERRHKKAGKHLGGLGKNNVQAEQNGAPMVQSEESAEEFRRAQKKMRTPHIADGENALEAHQAHREDPMAKLYRGSIEITLRDPRS